MRNPVRVLVEDFGWIHLTLGLIGNMTFVAGSVMFLPAFREWQTQAVWLFIVGSSLMLVGSLGRLLVDLFARQRGER